MTERKISVGVRILALAGGMLLAYGVTVAVLGFAAWIGPPRFYGKPLLISLVVVTGAGWLLRRYLTQGPARTTSMVATYACLVMLAVHGLGTEITSPKRIKTQMMAALQSLSISQEAFKRDSGRYTAVAPAEFTEMTDGMIHEIKLADGGWTATLTSPVYQRSCAVFVGTAPILPAVAEGKPECVDHPFRVTDHPFGLLALAVGAIIAVIAHLVHSRYRS